MKRVLGCLGLCLSILIIVGFIGYWYFTRPGSFDPPDEVITLNNVTNIHSIGELYGVSEEIAFSADGRIMVIEHTRNVSLWDTQTGKRTSLFRHISQSPFDKRELDPQYYINLTCLALSSDGTLLASGSEESTGKGSLKLWNVEQGKLLRTLDRGLKIQSVVFSPDGSLLAYSNMLDYTSSIYTRVVETQTGQEVLTFQGAGGFRFSPDGRLAVMATNAGIVLWEIESNQQFTLPDSKEDVGYFTFSPDGSILVSWFYLRPIAIWDVSTGSKLGEIPIRASTAQDSVVFSPDGSLLAIATSSGLVHLWSMQPLTEVRVFEGHSELVWSVAFNPEGTILASGGLWKDKTLRLWDVATGRELAVLHTKSAVFYVVFSPDGKLLVATGVEGTQVWGVP